LILKGFDFFNINKQISSILLVSLHFKNHLKINYLFNSKIVDYGVTPLNWHYSNMSQQSSIKLNIQQNKANFELEPLEEQPPCFQFGYFSKTLDPPKDNPEDLNNYRTVTIKCLYPGCT
jgi:hypothetical protein